MAQAAIGIVYLDLALIFLLFRFRRRIRFLRHCKRTKRIISQHTLYPAHVTVKDRKTTSAATNYDVVSVGKLMS